jgi:D-amino-acid dehydrogenase
MTEAGGVVVIGGGVIGASCAYYLAKTGRPVTLLDAGLFGDGCSHANCGYVCPSHVLPLAAPGAIRSILKTMARRNSPVRMKLGVLLRDPRWFLEFSKRCTEPHMLAAGVAIRALLDSSRTLYEEIIRTEQLECEWEHKGLLFVFRSKDVMNHYAEVDHLLREHFETPARRLDSEALAALEPTLKPGLAGAWLYERDAHLRPDKLMSEFRRILLGMGVTIRESCRVTGFARENGRATSTQTEQGAFPAEQFVVATGAWTPKLEREIGCRIPIQPGKGYSITFPRPAYCPTYPMIFEEDRVAVTPFQSGFRIGSMMEFRGYDTNLDPARINLLTETANRYLRTPATGPADEQWWGWRPMTPDGIPLIGPSPSLPNVFLAAGHNMLGLSMAPATGKLVAELLTKASPHLEPSHYAANRF